MNVETRMTKTDSELRTGFRALSFGFLSDLVIRHLSFVISIISTFEADFAWQFCSPAVPTECSLKNDGHVHL